MEDEKKIMSQFRVGCGCVVVALLGYYMTFIRESPSGRVVMPGSREDLENVSATLRERHKKSIETNDTILRVVKKDEEGE